MNRPWFQHALPDAFAGVPEIDTVLSRPHARALDVGCGAGWSSIALAGAYPRLVVEGVDLDAPSVDLARRNAAVARVAGRDTLTHRDARPVPRGGCDAAFD